MITIYIQNSDPSQIKLKNWQKYYFSMLDLHNRMGWRQYILTTKDLSAVWYKTGSV